jgi:hypothetical protein
MPGRFNVSYLEAAVGAWLVGKDGTSTHGSIAPGEVATERADDADNCLSDRWGGTKKMTGKAA